MRYCAFVAMVLFATSGCSSSDGSGEAGTGGGAGTGAGGGAGTGAGGGVSSAPPVPTAGPGEIVVTIRYHDQDTTSRCTTAGENTGLASYRTGDMPTPDGTTTMATLYVRCAGTATDAKTYQDLMLAFSRKALPTGSYTWSMPEGKVDDSLAYGEANLVQVTLHEDGNGMQDSFNGNAGHITSGTLNLDATGDGGNIRGTATMSWPRSNVMEGGAVNRSEERAGSASLAFDWPPKP